MREITEVTAWGKGRYLVSLDGEQAFILYKGELDRYGISQGKELSEEAYASILSETLLKRAQARSLHILKSMDRTEAQMRQRLAQGRYPQSVIEKVIRWLYGYHYLDDRRYAESYIAQKRGSLSRRQLLQNLEQRGVPKEVALEALGEEDTEDEQELIGRWLKKKHIDPETAEPKELQRMYQFLARKGFRASDIARALRR